jgi:hypothetical protein
MPNNTRTLATLALSAVVLAGCQSFGSMFPSHEEVFTPIGPTVGVARIDGKDTSWVLSGAGYELTSSNRELLPSVQTALDGAAADFRAYFAGDPPSRNVVALQLKRGQRPDTAALARIRATGAIPLYVRLAERGRGMSVGMTSGPDLVSVAPVVRAWVSAMASTPSASATTGTTTSAGVPRWLEIAIPSLIGGWSDADIVSAQIGMHPDRIISLRSIFSGQRPESDTTRRDARRDDQSIDGVIGRERGRDGYPRARPNPKDIPALSGTALWDAEALSITNYLATREGRPFIGTATRALMAGATMDEVLAGAQMVPRDVDTLDRNWRDWVATQAEALKESR